MNNLLHKIGEAIPNTATKNWLRRVSFPILFSSFGNRQVQLGPPEDKISVRIAHFPFYGERLGEREIEGYLQYYAPQPGDTVVNAGGYHGYFALYLAHKVGPAGRVFCFEPDPINADIITKNIAYNNYRNITVIKKGLWSKSTILPFETRGSSSRVSSPDKTSHHVPVCSLDDELRQHNVSNIHFMSMDIEGAELEAIKGAEQTIKASSTLKLAIASYHIVNGTRTAERVETLLRALGMTTHTGFPRHLTTYASRSTT